MRLTAVIAMSALVLACSSGRDDGSDPTDSGGSAGDGAAGLDGAADSGGDSGGSEGGDDGSGGTGDGAQADTPGGSFKCSPREAIAPTTAFFSDISVESGIRVDNYVPEPPVKIPINDHSRLGFADLNGDGYDDIVAHSLFPNPQAGIPFEHLVYLNNGDGTFAHWSDESGLRDLQVGFFAFGDVDNDGDQDCFAGLDIQLPGGSHSILLNDGEGRFTEVPGSGVDAINVPTVAGNAVFADFDGDAILDLFVGNGQTSFSSPDGFFIGQGDGTFDNESLRLAGNPAHPSNGSVTCDWDNDGDVDILVSTYGVSTALGANILWRNDGGSFTNVAVDAGFASLPGGNYFLAETGFGLDPEPGKGPGTYVGSNGFGVDCGDVNNDGYMDVFLTTISHPVSGDYNRKWSDPSQLLVNTGPAGGFALENEFLARGIPFNEGDVDGGMMDFDNDGRLDLSISRDKKYEGNYTDPQQKSWFGLMHQLPDGSFESLGVDSGINDPEEELKRMKAAQNHAWSDIDRDGDVDLLVGGRDTGGGRPNFLFRNEIGHQNRWIAIDVEGDGVNVNRDGIGTRVALVWPETTTVREVHASRGMYNSMDTQRLMFGLGDADCDYELEVRWPDGTTATFEPFEFPEEANLLLVYPDSLTVDP